MAVNNVSFTDAGVAAFYKTGFAIKICAVAGCVLWAVFITGDVGASSCNKTVAGAGAGVKIFCKISSTREGCAAITGCVGGARGAVNGCWGDTTDIGASDGAVVVVTAFVCDRGFASTPIGNTVAFLGPLFLCGCLIVVSCIFVGFGAVAVCTTWVGTGSLVWVLFKVGTASSFFDNSTHRWCYRCGRIQVRGAEKCNKY